MQLTHNITLRREGKAKKKNRGNFLRLSVDRCGVEPHIDPDVAGLLVDDEGLDRVSQGLQTLLPAALVLICRDEELWRQQDQLQTLLSPLHHDRPRTDTHTSGDEC